MKKILPGIGVPALALCILALIASSSWAGNAEHKSRGTIGKAAVTAGAVQQPDKFAQNNIITPDVANSALVVNQFDYVPTTGEFAICPDMTRHCSPKERVSPEVLVTLRFPRAKYLGFRVDNASLYLYLRKSK